MALQALSGSRDEARAGAGAGAGAEAGIGAGAYEPRIALACDSCGRMRAAHFANSWGGQKRDMPGELCVCLARIIGTFYAKQWRINPPPPPNHTPLHIP